MDSPRFISFPKISLDEKERYDPFYSRTRFLEGLPSRSQKWITSQHSFHFQTRFLAVVDTPRIAFVIRSPRRGSNPQKDPPLPFFLFFFGIVFPPSLLRSRETTQTNVMDFCDAHFYAVASSRSTR